MINLNQKDELVLFKNEEDAMDKLKKWKLLSPKAKEIKEFKYKGIFNNIGEKGVKCEVVGYIQKFTNNNCLNMTYETLVIKIENTFHKISIEYFKDMQKKGFRLNEAEELED